MGFLVRLLIGAFGLWAAAELVPGMRIEGWETLLGASFLLGIVNAIVRPVFVFLTLPITFITLGLFLLVINGAMLGLVAWFLPKFSIDGIIPAVLGAVLVAVISWIGNKFVGGGDD